MWQKFLLIRRTSTACEGRVGDGRKEDHCTSNDSRNPSVWELSKWSSVRGQHAYSEQMWHHYQPAHMEGKGDGGTAISNKDIWNLLETAQETSDWAQAAGTAWTSHKAGWHLWEMHTNRQAAAQWERLSGVITLPHLVRMGGGGEKF